MTRMGRESTGTCWLLATALALIMGPSLVTASKAPSPLPARTLSKLQAIESYGKLPLRFEANKGQTDRQVNFVARGRAYTLFLAENEAVFALRSAEVESVESVGSVPGKEQSSHLRAELSERTKRTQPTKQAVLRMRLEGANRSPMAHGVAPLPGVVNYFIGNDPKKWRTHIPTYEKVEYKNIYPGIDVVYYGNQGKLEYDFVVSPGADPNQIKLAFEGAENPRLADNGDVTLTVSGADLYLKKPLVYQQDEKGRKQLVAGNYILLATDSPRAGDPLHSPEQRVPFTPHVAIQVASYDRSRPLVIDPVLAYSTHLGGSGGDQGFGVAVDAVGNAYVTGFAGSSDFPTTAGAFQTAFGGGEADAFVTKLNPTGSALVYTTYLGGDGFDQGHGIAVDATGNAYVTGHTFSTNFPTTTGTVQPGFSGVSSIIGDAFVTKLNATGSALVYSTYLGGGDDDEGFGMAVDATGNAYVTGQTLSTNFPTTADTVQPGFAGTIDAFMTKLNPTGSGLVYSTYLGGDSDDLGNGIAVDATGNAYVTGLTFSTNFPTTPGAFQTTPNFASDAFVVKLNAAGTALVYSTYLGGDGFDQGQGIAVDAEGNAYATGGTSSTNFPTTTGAFRTTFGGRSDAFVTKLNGDGSALVYSTYLGGFSSDRGNAIAVDATGNAYVTGLTFSTNFPTTPGAVRETFGGILDAFMVKLNPAGTALVYSTFLGGSSLDEGFGIAVDTAGSAYVTGGTESPDFPTTPGAVQTGFGGTPDAFVAKLAEINTPAGGNVLVQPVDLATGTTPVTLTFSNVAGAGVTGLATSRTGPPPPAGFKPGSPPTYFDITTTAVSSASASVLVCINYTGITFSAFSSTAGLMRLMHFAGTGFVDVTTSLDTTAAVICGLVNSLSPFAIFEPSIQAQAFATFRPKVEIELSPGANNDSFEVEGSFTLGAGAGIAPLTEDLTLKVGSYSTTIPAGFFKQKKGQFKFRGVIDGVRLTAKIQPRARGGFKFEAEGKCAELTGTVNPVTVELTIGEDVGSATVKADISSRSEGRKCGDRRDDDKDDDDD